MEDEIGSLTGKQTLVAATKFLVAICFLEKNVTNPAAVTKPHFS